MKTYPNAILKVNPSRRDIVKQLGYPNGKLPADFTTTRIMTLRDWRGNDLGAFQIEVTESWGPIPCPQSRKGYVKSSKHRIFARIHGKLIPVGRMAQATLPTPLPPQDPITTTPPSASFESVDRNTDGTINSPTAHLKVLDDDHDHGSVPGYEAAILEAFEQAFPSEPDDFHYGDFWEIMYAENLTITEMSNPEVIRVILLKYGR